MSFIWSTAKKDWRRNRRDPVGLVLWIGSPLVVGVLLSLMSGGSEGPKPQAHVLVVDHDDTFLSGFLIGAMSQEAAGGLIRAEEVEEEKGRARLEERGASALLVIPEGFSDAVLREEPVALELVKNPAQRIFPGIVEETFSIVVDATFYLHRLIGEDLRQFADGPPDDENTFPDLQIADFSVRVNQIVDELGDSLFSPVITLDTGPVEVGEEEEDDVSVALLFLPGLLFMALLFMARGLSDDLWHERDHRTLRRVVVSPRSTVEFLAGKLVAGAGMVLLVASISLVIGYAYFGLDWASLPLAVAWTTLSGALLITMMSVLQLLTTSQRAGNVITMVVVFPLIMLGGSFFPFKAMPEGMAAIGKMTPNGWALEQLKAILLDRVDAAALGKSLLGVVAVTMGLFVLSARRLRAGFAQG